MGTKAHHSELLRKRKLNLHWKQPDCSQNSNFVLKKWGTKHAEEDLEKGVFNNYWWEVSKNIKARISIYSSYSTSVNVLKKSNQVTTEIHVQPCFLEQSLSSQVAKLLRCPLMKEWIKKRQHDTWGIFFPES